MSWTFNFDFAHYLLAGVIWAIGWSMIVLAGLVRLPLAAIAALGALVVAGHNLLDPVVANLNPEGPPRSWLWQCSTWVARSNWRGWPAPCHSLCLDPMGRSDGAGLCVRSSAGVGARARRRTCYALGLGAIAAFLILRGFNLYGDPRHWEGSRMPAPLSFLNTTKYPASLQFLLMTLGPAIAAIPLLEHARGKVADFFAVFGRVPLFYYLLHIPLIHALACGVSLIREGQVDPWLFTNHPMRPGDLPDGYVWNLGLLYLVFAIAIGILYFPCRWFAGLKAKSRAGWMSYL
jgi:uncharacterized membrane protein